MCLELSQNCMVCGTTVDIILFNTKEFEKLKKEISIVSEALREGVEI